MDQIFFTGFKCFRQYFLTAFIQDIYLLISVKIVSASLFYLLIMWASRSATFRESMEYLLKRERKV